MARSAVLFVALPALAALLLLTSGCYVHATVNSHGHYHHRPAYTSSSAYVGWVYYPEYDVYYSSNAGHWCYHDGGRWVVVTSRPTWFSAGSRTSTVRIEYSGSRPFDHWDTHHSRWGVRYHSSRSPRAWGHRGHDHHDHDHGHSRTYRYSERRY